MLQDVERSHQLAGPGLQREVPGVGADGADAPGLRDVGDRVRVLQRQGAPAVLLEYPGVAAARRADIQGLARGGQPAEFAGEDGATFLVPPVAVLKRGEELELGGFHGLLLTAPGVVM